MNIRIWGLAVVLSFGVGSARAQQAKPKPAAAEFPGWAVKWVTIAEPMFERQNLDIDEYKVYVSDEGAEVYVNFIDRGLK